MSKNNGLFGLLAAAIFLGGCASGATAQGMTVKAADIAGPASPEVARSVGVGEVEGGEATDSWGSSQIDNPEFKKALVRSLQAAGLLASGTTPKYVLSADLVSLEQPVVGLDMTVTSRVRYVLKDTTTGAAVFSEEVAARFTATPGDALYGPSRLRVANEGSARKSIAILIQKLNAAGKANGNAQLAAPVRVAATHSL
jgi:hypothetical protein